MQLTSYTSKYEDAWERSSASDHITSKPPLLGTSTKQLFNTTNSLGNIIMESADYTLGQRLASYLKDKTSPTEKLISGLLQDLMGEDQSLHPPLQDLIAKPAFKQVILDHQAKNSEVLRDSLLIELSQIYNLQIINRLNDFLKGYLEFNESNQPSLTNVKSNVNQKGYSNSTASKVYEESTIVEESSPLTRGSINSRQQSTFGSHQISRQTGFDPGQGNQTNKLLLLISGVALGGLLVGGTALVTFHLQQPKQSRILSAEPKETPTPVIPSTQEDENLSDDNTTSDDEIQPFYITQSQAKGTVEKWLIAKSKIFAPPFDMSLASDTVSRGPLWTDLTRPNGSIQWLKKYNRYYTYPTLKINKVINFYPSPTRPSIVVSITETSRLHTPNGNETSNNTNLWTYTLKREGGQWKIWDYKKKAA